MLGPRIVVFEAVILLSGCLLSLLFYVLSLQKSIVLGPRIVVFEAVIMLSCCLLSLMLLLFSLFYVLSLR